MKQTMLAVLISLMTGLSAPVLAGEHDGGKFLAKMTRELKLTPDQEKKLKELHEQGKDTMKGHKEQMKAAHEDLEKALRSNADENEVRSKFNALQKLQDEFAKARFEKVLSIRAILTPEQRQQFKGMGPEHRDGFKHRHHHHEDGPSEGGKPSGKSAGKSSGK